MTDPLLDHALALHAAGVAVLPVRDDGSKAPAVDWKPYITTGPDEPQVRAWFTDTTHGLGIITGTVSGHLEMTELEGRAATALPDLRALAIDTGLGDLWDTITRGWVETSPSGGFHFHYRLTDAPVSGNTKLARRPSTDDELAAWKTRETTKAQALDPAMRTKRLERIAATTHAQLPQVLAETRGEGGYVVVAPTPGTHHPTGRPWVLLLGGPHQIPTITAAQRDAFHSLLRTLDEMPTPDPAPAPSRPARDPGDGITPGDDYETKTDWTDLLVPHGWTHISTRGRTRYWLRPGKDKGQGISATTGHADDRDRLFVFTSSTEFTPETPYTKFGAYALLEHAGDHTAAAKALAADGYGQRPRENTLRLVSDLDGLIPTPPPAPAARPATGSPRPATAGANALATHPAPATITEHRMTLTDVGNAQLLVAKHGHRIRYVARRGNWLTWDGTRWATDDLGTVNELAKQTILDIHTDGNETAAKHRTRSLSRRAIEAMVALSRTDPAVAVTPQQLDAHPYHLCTPGGVVNLRTGHLDPPNPADLHTRSTSVTPDPGQPTPRWDAFLEQTFVGRPDLAEFVQRLAGYSALGVVTRHVLPFLLGPGGNGKGVLLDVLRSLLGDYAATTPAKFLMAGVNQHETEIARLSGLRLIISSEVNEEDRFDEAKVKLLTGGDALTARFMNQDHFTFVPTHTLWLMGNHQPRVSSGGDSFWRRLRLVPFDHTVPDEERIDGLDKLLVTEEGPGILAWIIDGATKAIAGGLAEPDVVMAATKVYAAEEDHLARFVEDRLHLGGGTNARTPTAALRGAYDTWCRQQGEKPHSPQAFGRELRTRFGIDQTRSNGLRYYVGVVLLADENEPDAPDEWWQR